MSTPSPTPGPVAEPNPLANALTSFIGSANLQKTLGVLQVGIAGLTGTEGTSTAQRIAGMSIGGAFALGVHWFDYLRAKIGR